MGPSTEVPLKAEVQTTTTAAPTTADPVVAAVSSRGQLRSELKGASYEEGAAKLSARTHDDDCDHDREKSGGDAAKTATKTTGGTAALTADQIKAAIASASTLDSKSIRIIQITVGDKVDGTFDAGTAKKLAAWQKKKGQTADGKIVAATLTPLVTVRAADDDHDLCIHLVSDFYNLSNADTLTVHYTPVQLFAGATTFETGGMRVVSIGALAFTSVSKLKDTIRLELAKPAPAAAAKKATPKRLSDADAKTACAQVAGKLGDKRSIRGLQGIVGAPITGTVDAATVQHLAQYQKGKGLTAKGTLDHATLGKIIKSLAAADSHNTAIRMVMDYFNMSDYGALVDISYDVSVTSNASTGGHNPGPSTIRVGTKTFKKDLAGFAHTIAHELEHVRQRREGIASSATREFLGEAIEILSVGMPAEGIRGFFYDAKRCIKKWIAMPVADKKRYWTRFTKVCAKVKSRHGSASASDKTKYQTIVDKFTAQTRPT